MRALNPDVIAGNPEHSKTLMTNLVKTFGVQNLLPDIAVGDLIVQQFRDLVDVDENFRKELSSYKSAPVEMQPRLDTFYWNAVGTREHYKELWMMVRKLLTLSHGNATVRYTYNM